MAEKGSDRYHDIQVFKGLQRPLELLGLQGRYVWWGVGSGGGGLLSLMIGAIVFGFLIGLILFTVIVGTGTIMILVKQRHGLHTKHVDKGIFVYYRTNDRFGGIY